MRKLLLLPLLLLLFMLLLTVNVSGSKAAFSLNQVLSLPTLGKSYVSPINSSLRSQTDDSQEITPDLRFGVISDTHVKSTDPVTQNKFQQMLSDMEKLKVPNLVINGDLGDGMPQDYDTLKKLIKRKNNRPTLYYTIGNHEFYKALPRDANGQALPNQSEGLVVEVFKNKVLIKGRDFLSRTWIPESRYEF